MSEARPAVGSFLQIEKVALQALIDALLLHGYRVIGPRLREAAVVLDDLACVDELPRGWLDDQEGGSYRLRQDAEAGWFDYVVGPHSLKQFLFPPRTVLLESTRLGEGEGAGWDFRVPQPPIRPLAVLGARSCELHALRIQDKVFLESPYPDPEYRRRRAELFVVAINCRRAAATCFCHAMNTGPAVGEGFDLALTERDDAFVVEIGSDRGAEIMQSVGGQLCSAEEIESARRVPADLSQRMAARSLNAAPGDAARGRQLKTDGIHDLLLGNLEHPRWDEVAKRCLACGNCTMVCPTCFCSSVQDVSDLAGDECQRVRQWDSCFTCEHSHMSSGAVRKSIKAQYRQWLTHKLASWIDQFGSSGCVGCGRCITWCPVGIDLTEEVAAIRGAKA